MAKIPLWRYSYAWFLSFWSNHCGKALVYSTDYQQEQKIQVLMQHFLLLSHLLMTSYCNYGFEGDFFVVCHILQFDNDVTAQPKLYFLF